MSNASASLVSISTSADDSDEAGQLLRIYQQYFMVSNAAQLILKEAQERGVDLYHLHEHVCIQINDTHPTMVIPRVKLTLSHHPVVERSVVLKFQRADRVGDLLHRVLDGMGEIVHGVDAPFVPRVVVGHVGHPVDDGVAHVDVGRRHVDLRPQHLLPILELPVLHSLKESQVLLHRAVPVGAVLSGDSVYAFDPTKLSVHTLDIGLAGIEVYDILRDEYDIQIEFGDLGNMLAYLSIGDRKQEVERLVSALADIKRRYQKDKTGMLSQEYIPPPATGTPCSNCREIFLWQAANAVTAVTSRISARM